MLHYPSSSSFLGHVVCLQNSGSCRARRQPVVVVDQHFYRKRAAWLADARHSPSPRRDHSLLSLTWLTGAHRQHPLLNHNDVCGPFLVPFSHCINKFTWLPLLGSFYNSCPPASDFLLPMHVYCLWPHRDVSGDVAPLLPYIYHFPLLQLLTTFFLKKQLLFTLSLSPSNKHEFSLSPSLDFILRLFYYINGCWLDSLISIGPSSMWERLKGPSVHWRDDPKYRPGSRKCVGPNPCPKCSNWIS